MIKEYIVELREEEADDLMDEHWVGELVRCKDCKYWIRQTAEKGGESVLGINYTTCVCKKFRDWDTWNEYDSNFGRTDEDWFCANGERREKDD